MMPSSTSQIKRVFNFSAGPCCLPLEVLEEAQRNLISWNQCGMSVMEMSHRGKEFLHIYHETIADLKQLLDVPDSHEILFVQGGATLQFAAVPLNLFSSNTLNMADVAITGSWSQKQFEEIKKYGIVNAACDGSINGKFLRIPHVNEWSINPKSTFLHYCANETVNGVEFRYTPDVKIPLVSDMSSNFCSKPIDIAKHLLIYGGIQKNLGPAGAAIVIVEKEAINSHSPLPICPTLLDYRVTMRTESMYNTPPCWSIYMTGLVAKYLKRQGGLSAAEERSERKSKLLYDFIDSSDHYYSNNIETSCRSNMNIPFRILTDNVNLEKKFVLESEEKGFLYLGGHRSVGGCRASLYNGMPIEGVDALIEFMKTFMETNPSHSTF